MLTRGAARSGEIITPFGTDMHTRRYKWRAERVCIRQDMDGDTYTADPRGLPSRSGARGAPLMVRTIVRREPERMPMLAVPAAVASVTRASASTRASDRTRLRCMSACSSNEAAALARASPFRRIEMARQAVSSAGSASRKRRGRRCTRAHRSRARLWHWRACPSQREARCTRGFGAR